MAEELGSLDVLHCLGECRVAEAALHLLGADVLDMGLDPPEVAQWVAYAPDAVTEEQVGDVGDRGAAGRDGLPVHRIRTSAWSMLPSSPTTRDDPRRHGGVALRNWLDGHIATSWPVVSRDIERLRDLGYPVQAIRGGAGGYRLAAGAAMPPLLLDDQEAVAIVVGLRAAAGHAVDGIQEASVRALAKLEQVLPSRLRHRVRAPPPSR